MEVPFFCIFLMVDRGTYSFFTWKIGEGALKGAGVLKRANMVTHSDADKDAYCVCTHGLLVGKHGNFKPSAYRVHIKV